MAAAVGAAESAVGEVLRGHHEEPGLRIEVTALTVGHRLLMAAHDLDVKRVGGVEPVRMRLRERARRQLIAAIWCIHERDDNPMRRLLRARGSA